MKTQNRNVAIPTGHPEILSKRIAKWEPEWGPKEHPKWYLWGGPKCPKRFAFLMFPHKTVGGGDPKRDPNGARKCTQTHP